MVKVSKSKNGFDHSRFNVFCKDNDLKFPKSYVDHLQIYNDGDLELNCVEFQDNATNIRYFYGTSTEESYDLIAVYQVYKDRIPKNCVAIAEDDFGNQICISLNTDTYGKIYFWDHEKMDADENEKNKLQVNDMILIANSFEEFCSKIQSLDTDDIPHYSSIRITWNRFVSWLRTKWDKL